MHAKPCVLLIGEYGLLNGGERSLLAVLDHLQNDWRFKALVPGNTEFETALHRRQIETLPWATHLDDGQRKTQSEIREELKQAIQTQSDLSLVHCNSVSTCRLLGPVCSCLKIPSVGVMRDILKLSRKAIEDINLIDRKLTVSQATRDFHVQQGLDPDSTWVQYNGVNTQTFRPPNDDHPPKDKVTLRSHRPHQSQRPPMGELGIDPQHETILFVGQIGMRKGIDLLLDVHDRLTQQRRCHLLIVGERNSQKQEAIEYERELRARTKSNPLVHWLGRRTDVALLMQRADLLIHPARQEPLGRVLLEALASGLPVVTTQVGGTAEIIPPEFHDLMVARDDVDAMTAVATRLLSDAPWRQKIETEFPRYAQRRFSIQQSAAGLDQHYRQAIKCRN